jgi:glucokinase
VHAKEGVVKLSPNIPCWKDYPARERLERVLGVRVRLDNDANCAAVAEGWIGAGRGTPSFLLLTLGTGVGGGVMLDGRIWRGESGRGGEVGHVVVEPDGSPCGCGSRGCLETVASSQGILRMASEAGLSAGVEELAILARSGDVRAASLFSRAGSALGIAIAGWLNTLDVHTIIIAGGVLPALDLIEPSIRAEVGERAYGLDRSALRILPASLGADAGIVGAARLVMGS